MTLVCDAWGAGFFTWPVAVSADIILSRLFPDVIAAIEQQGHLLDIVTKLAPPVNADISVPDGKQSILVFELNPLVYSYNLPLLAAMITAVPATEKQIWLRLGIGAIVLLPIQLGCVCIDIIKTLVFDLGPDATSNMSFNGFAIDIVALAYQFGSLILPPLSPVVVWVLLHQAYLKELVPDAP